MSSIHRFTYTASALALLAVLAGCNKQGATSGAPQMPPTEVSVVTIEQKPIAIISDLPGRIEATRISQVRARVAGIVLKRTFEEGSEVKAGQVLFRIDPAPFQATADSAKAALAKAEANLTQTSLTAKRYKPLVEANAISKQEYDDAVTAEKQAEADVASAKAALTTANLNLSYATVTAPISGRIGKAQVTEGALVGQGDATQLATIQQLDPIYVNLTQSSTDLLRLRKAVEEGKIKGVVGSQAEVHITLEDGSEYPYAGKLLFSDVTVDEGTNTVTLRAEFPNKDRNLLPGMYVRTKLEQAIDENAITVPQQAVVRTTNGSIVMIVDKDNKVAAHPVQTAGTQGNDWIITQGLNTGDRVIVEGLQKTAPGATVSPVPWKNASAPAAAPAANAEQTKQ